MYKLAVVGLVLLMSGTALSAESPASVAMAEAVAPFIDEGTILIVHADISRLDPSPFIPVAMELSPGAQRTTAEWKRQSIQNVDEFLKSLALAGANDLYVLFSLRMLHWPALVVPLPEDLDKARLDELMAKANSAEGKLVKGALVLGPESTLDQFAKFPPDPRPELAAAFEAAGDKASHVLILPPKHMMEVLGAVLPVLPEEWGGGPSSLIANLKWIALGSNVTPPASHQAVTQARDEQGAVALREKWSQIVRLLGKNEKFRKAVGNYEEIAPQVIPEVEGDRLILVHAEGSPAALAQEKMLESVFQWARSRIEKEVDQDRTE
jgi:hypothetical protein